MSEVEVCVLHEVDGAEGLETIGSRRDGWLRQDWGSAGCCNVQG